jgi:hypothetical protein
MAMKTRTQTQQKKQENEFKTASWDIIKWEFDNILNDSILDEVEFAMIEEDE